MDDLNCENCHQPINPGDEVIPLGITEDTRIVMSGELILVHVTCPPKHAPMCTATHAPGEPCSR